MVRDALIVYTLPSCVQCTATKRALDTAGVPYVTVDLTVDKTAVDLVKELGHTQAPVVTVGGASWSGYRPDVIAVVAAARATTPGVRKFA
ncbi:NrdH-redoxin [Subtercola boreus]|uniref:NrdH-redoxin n=2 Tax=Subtercola boreus TaxID=120213 RepID=A0A3E0VUQ8_9MICO|nr:glutaredoxin domain-containing protein [Subtercola boreus]RFA13093.1 NrdH-redoxin [Subtercola boreus]